MAELRIPTDRIPADILQRLQAIGHSIIFPGTASTATTTTTAATLSTTKSSIAASQNLASVGASVGSMAPVANAAAAALSAGTQSKESHADSGISLSAACSSLEPTFLNTTSQMTKSSSTPLSSLSSFPSTSSSPPLLGPFSSPPNRPTEHFASFTSFVDRAQSSSHSHQRSISSTSDETDGQASVTDPASIVHVLDLNQHRKRGGHPLDESDIVRIFPLEDEPGAQEEPDNMSNAIERPSEIVRVFPELSHKPTERSVELESPRANRVFSTPTKRQKINRHNSSTVSTDINSSNINLHHQQQQQQQQQQQCIQPPPPTSCLSAGSIVPHMLSQPPVFTLGDGETEEFHNDELQNHNEVLNVNNSPFKGKISTSVANTTNQMRASSSSTSVQKLNQSFCSPSRSRLTPPVPAISRRSPGGLVTPPMTPDDIGEDEVFTYDNTKDDSLSLSGRRAFATYRQKIECTPRRGSPTPSHTPSSSQRRHSDLALEHRQVKHAQFHPDHAHNASNSASAPPKCSPFSPAQRFSELSFGDRQHTRKRLSFEDCVEKSGDRIIDIDNCASASEERYSPSQDASGKLPPNYHSDPSLTQYQHNYPSHSNTRRENTPLHRAGQSQDPEVSHQYTLHKNLQSYRPRPSKSVSPSIFSFDQTDINKNGINKATSGSTITVSSPYKFASSHRAMTHNADMAKSQVSHQSHDASFYNNALLHSNAKCHSQAPPSSPVHPIPVQNLDPSHCRTPAYVHNTSHKSEVFPRGRLHSEGDNSTPDLAGFPQARQRLQTFSHGKRRRLDMQESEENGDPISAHTTSASQSPAFAHQTTESNPLPASVHRTFPPHQQQPRHQQPQQSQREQHQNYQQQQQSQPPSPAAHVAECGPCACATIERDFLQVAEYAYKRIRCLDNSPGDFDRFRREMAQTNDMLKEWLIIMGNIRNICGHSPSTSVQTPANTISSVPSASSSSSSSSAQASSTTSLPMPVSISGSSSLTPSSEGRTSSSSPAISSAYCLNTPASQPVSCVVSAPSYPNNHPFQAPVPSGSTMVQNSMQFSSMSVGNNEHFH
ncbi:hypothetical protein PoB_006709400 [Plakobranchus ocellatus]|uniref:Uncharacterized protein n=1 Tax=Plakobranchus ocellatus TaxID=259542 RepID=A0AAV4D8W3_9GAST|nr:hypothetical protein PoB_006709400 [Plakobranchus ocellatus]